MNKTPEYVVLTVIEDSEGKHMATYTPQVAMAHHYNSLQDAAVFNVGTHPDAKSKGKGPYKRVVVIPWEYWYVFDVYFETVKGKDTFKAYPTENPPIRARSKSPDMD